MIKNQPPDIDMSDESWSGDEDEDQEDVPCTLENTVTCGDVLGRKT